MSSFTFICAVLLVLVYGIRTLLRCVSSVLDKIPGPPSKSWLTGHLTQFYDPDGWAFQKDLEENYGQVVRLHGLFGDRGLYVFDPAALHSILIKDQNIYEEMPKFQSLNKLLFGPGIFSSIGDDHRKYRKIMIPAFSTANLRGMVPQFYDVAERLDLNAILCRTSLELIGRTGIGYSFDSMLPGKEQANPYAEALRALFPVAFKLSVLLPLLPLILKIPFPSFRRFMINLVPSPMLHHLRDLVDITDGIATQLVAERKAAIKSGVLDVKEDAKDIMSLMMKSNASAEGSIRLTDSELVASLAMTIFAATDTTASSMNRMFHILALYPEAQEKLRAEILDAPEHLHHDALVALPYLDSFVRELLRLFPPTSPAMYREAYEDAILPLRTPMIGVDGILMNTITVPKGTSIYIAIAAANHSKQIWGDDALEFKPERWTNGKAESVTTKMCGIYGNTMTFVGGGRSCIGFKFAQLEMKAVASVLLRAFKFSTPDPRIQWRMTGAVPSPSVHGQPGLPILVEHLKV
ncbi:cytochrome P450 [Mycena rosella]|uniref:Cytochrome P450 n=1 Tax=Mycena rosella TaxID=1033263 RepID=A0AAD7FVT0_MYCRO|nr:cytochrome P450 [Mycena rosella]